MVRLAALAGALSAALLAQSISVSEHRPANGMKILIHEDHDIPNVAMYLFYRIGSRNERPGATGMSHFFEHMMFNGAKKFGPKMFDIVMEQNGGRNNAYTSRDLTVYQNWFPSSAAPVIFDLEADRIAHLSFDPKIIESERGVVSSERRLRVDNDNLGLLFEHLNATLYLAHPYQWPVVGWASDIEAWSLDDLQQHFRMGYAPNNCLLVVAGALSAHHVLALAHKYFSPDNLQFTLLGNAAPLRPLLSRYAPVPRVIPLTAPGIAVPQ
jgi:zinc protease